jgi:hypothetical protein
VDNYGQRDNDQGDAHQEFACNPMGSYDDQEEDEHQSENLKYFIL